MPGGIYVALSGLRHHAEQLDQLASDIANASTSGYKTEHSSSVASERPSFSSALQSAIDVAPGERKIDFTPGRVTGTGRDLDFALESRGFFVVETPDGLQYTRNGHFRVDVDGTVTTADGFVVQGELGNDEEYGPIVLPAGTVGAEPDGTVTVDGLPSGKFRIADFSNYDVLARSAAGRFSVAAGTEPTRLDDVKLRGGALEQSNASMAERLVQVTEVARTFEALQRGISVLMNDIDGRAINELGRR